MKDFIMDASGELNTKDPRYKNAVSRYVWEAYLDDLGSGDVTTELFIPNKTRITEAEVVSKERGVLAGIEEAEWLLKKLEIRITYKKKDGSKLKKNDTIMRISGRADRILASERTLLNLLQRMSGVATATNRLVQQAPRDVKVLATRKTLWGELDKKAVSVGGGATHRLNLSDAVLIKDNHIALIDGDNGFNPLFFQARKLRFIEIEFDDIRQVITFARRFKKAAVRKMVVMLDNFKPEDIKKAVKILRNTSALIEVSGGINERNVRNYAVKGVSAVSSGAITKKAPSLDFSLNIKTK